MELSGGVQGDEDTPTCDSTSKSLAAQQRDLGEYDGMRKMWKRSMSW